MGKIEELKNKEIKEIEKFVKANDLKEEWHGKPRELDCTLFLKGTDLIMDINFNEGDDYIHYYYSRTGCENVDNVGKSKNIKEILRIFQTLINDWE